MTSQSAELADKAKQRLLRLLSDLDRDRSTLAWDDPAAAAVAERSGREVFTQLIDAATAALHNLDRVLTSMNEDPAQ